MPLRRHVALAAAALAARLALAAPGDPTTSEEVVEAARAEGRVVIHATTDPDAAAPLLADFAALHPDIRVEYVEMGSSELYERSLRADASVGSADLLWSSAMDLQMKLANDGYALRYASPEARRIPTWAVWKDEAFGTTYEPIGFVYNTRLLAAAEVPDSHAALVKALREQPERFRGKLAAYDPARSGIGFLLLTQAARTDPAFAEAAKAYGDAGVKLYATTAEMMRRVGAGEALIAVDAIGSYALAARRGDPSVGFVTPRDYTLVMSRIALVPRAAMHPSAAKVFLDYLLSLRGQQVLARAELYAIRPEATGDATAAALARSLGASLRPIPVSPSLLVYLDRAKRAEFLRRWADALGDTSQK
jgi:iron(III) transport system substrate-binding protein